MTTVNGGSGNDVLNGGNGDDTMDGKSGDDTINGGGGNDDINGGSGDDTIDGGSGDDDLDGGSGDDEIHGGSGRDVIDGGSGDDDLFGDDDNDIIDGHSGNDDIFGGGGADILRGFTGNDHLHGNAGNDYIDGGNGFDTAYFNANIEEFTFQRVGATLIVTHLGGAGSEGQDTLVNVERLVFNNRVVNPGGGNNAPIAVDDAATTGEDSAGVSGNVLINDFDFEGSPLSVAAGTFIGTYGTLTLSANGAYTYVLNANAQSLDSGEVGQDVFNYSVSDGSLSDTGKLTININGANDAPVANDDMASTGEDGTAAGNVLANDTDVDGEPLTVGNPGTYAGTYGTLVLAADGSYTYTPGAAAQALNGGDVVNDVFSYTASDGTASDTATLTITVTGADDSAGPPWYIDNNAVGSANTGSASDPFTSIAAFNAAQGSPDGPGPGDQIFLLAGIYAEADGINLLDGQILTGIGDPLIAPTAGDGVNVGLDNSLSGLGIVSGDNAGIADSGGSVGALNVSGVFISTTGGIGIDFDGGGANVSITNTSISSAANYAILGANVAGFALTDSSASSGAASSGTIALTGLTGTADFLGNLVNGGGGDTLSIVNGGGNLILNIADSVSNEAIFGPNDDGTGDDAVTITTNGGALTLTIDGVDFQGAREDLLEINALGSSTQNLTISNNNFDNGQTSAGGGGVELNGGGAGSDIAVDYQFVGNSITGVSGSAFSGAYTQQSGTVRGYIAGNVIGVANGVGGSEGSANGDGISASLQKSAGPGDATYVVTIFDNDIHDVNGGSGIALRASGGTAAGAAVLEATVLENVVDEHGDFAFAGLYALVGGAGAGDFSELGLVLDGNVIDAGEADFGLDAIYLDQVSADAHFYVPGYSGSSNGEFAASPGTASVDLSAFWSANNTLVPTPFSVFGGVDASFVTGLTGDPLTQPAYFP